MIDLVYILGRGSLWGDNELRYSLRSVEQFGQNVGRVIIVGHKPEWLVNVEHIPCADPYLLKCDNTWYKMRLTCQSHPAPFVLMNDDFFLLVPTDFETIPRYYHGQISDLIERLTGRHQRRTPYAAMLETTKMVLENNNRTTRNYSIHVPIIIDPIKILPLFPLFPSAPAISFRSLYGNVIRGNDEPLPDLKLHEPHTKQAAMDAIAEAKFFSIGDGFLNGSGKDFLFDLYPTKSKFEQ